MTSTTDAGPRPAASAPDEISIYAAIGGRPALVAAVDIFFGRLLADPDLAAFFPAGAGEIHRRYLVTFLGQALGGPERYRGRDVAVAHHGLGITDRHFDAVAGHLIATLDELAVPQHRTDQIIAIVAGLRPAVVNV
jgi:hemoglobin